MTPPPPRGSEHGRLDSWKAIADYLRHDVSTVMRWEKSSGLPVRRVPGRRGRSVFAFTAEIDLWLKGQRASSPQLFQPDAPGMPVPPAAVPRPRRSWIWASVSALAGLAGVAAIASRGFVPPLIDRASGGTTITTSFELPRSMDGRYLFAAGASNALGGAVMAVLPGHSIDGLFPSGGPAVCLDCPPGQPIAYIVVPWSDVADAGQLPRAFVSVSSSGRAELRALQASPAASTQPEVIVALNERLEVVERRVNDDYWIRHAQLEREGRLSHAAAQCPWRTAPPIRRWLPQTGWQDLK